MTASPAASPEMGFATVLDVPLDEAIARTRDALKSEGFGVLTEIDVRSTLKEKLDVDFKPYVILGACNPSLAHRALQEMDDVGLLLPCNVTVHEHEGGSRVTAVNPDVMLAGAGDMPEIRAVAVEARERLQRVIATLESATPQ